MIVGQREEAKKKTRSLIITRAKELFIAGGFLKTTTKEIAREAGIAHGTLFFHFPTKEELILEIYDQELQGVTDQLHPLLHDTRDAMILLERYLSFLESEEDFFAVMAKELPFYPETLQRQVIFREGGIRGYFVMALHQGITEKRYRPMEVPEVLTFLFGTIHYLLRTREMIAGDKSVISMKKESIKNNFWQLIKPE